MDETNAKHDALYKNDRDPWFQGLVDGDKQKVRDQQNYNAAVNRKPDTAPNFSKMSVQEISEYCDRGGK